MNKILLIGNSGIKRNGTDGQTVKVRLYLKKIQDEGFDVLFVDLESFSKHPISKLFQIKKYIEKCDRIVLLTAERGTRILVPFINYVNKKYRKPFVFPLIGLGVLHFYMKNLSKQQQLDFLVNKNYSICQRNVKWEKQLSKMTYILPETDELCDAYIHFLHLNNVYKLNNFRDFESIKTQIYSVNNPIKAIYLSRVWREKGIFDLLEVVGNINKNGIKIELDIFGSKNLNSYEDVAFNKFINENDEIKYHGPIDSSHVVSALSKYDIFIFPTRYTGEGTPGVISESLIAGVPVLTADFAQANLLLKDGCDSLFYKMFDKRDLEEKMMYIINNKEVLIKMREKAAESGKQYTYTFERDNFLHYVCGLDIEEKKI